MKINPFVLVLVAVMLSACGGGGGGSNAASSMPETTPSDTPNSMPEATQPNTPMPLTNFGAMPDTPDLDPSEVSPSLQNPNAYENAIQVAAVAIPRFGSITQSSNVDAEGLTTDHATGSFNSDTAAITVTQADDSSFSFGETFPAYWGPRDFAQDDLRRWAVPSHDSGRRSYHAFIFDDGSYHADYLGVSWNSADASDYSVWGYWLRSDGNPFAPDATFEIGAFNDGPALRSANAPTLPESGTATYTGEGQGIYHHQYGPGPEYGEYAEAIEIGQYVVPYEMRVDFGQSLVSVCGNCDTNAQLDHHGLWGDGRKTDGTYYRFEAAPTAYRLEGTATVNADGTFRSQQVILTNPDKPVTSYEGSMGGIFYGSNGGNPDGATGTTGGTYTHAGGESGSFVGTFGVVLSP